MQLTKLLTTPQKQFLLLIIVIINFSYLHRAVCLECSEHRFDAALNTTHMQFTKEIVSQEYAVLGQFKSLHCCAKGYRSIEWFKDDKPYPWPGDISSLILYPEAANQTIYSRSLSSVDEGTYKCVLRNDTHKIEHHTSMKVQVSSPDRPMATFKPMNQYVSIGEPARFFCEAFVGKVELPDARTEITWYRLFEDDQEQEMEGIQETVSRDDGQIVGKYLTIPAVTKHSYGRYVCRFEMGNSAHRLEVSAWLFGVPISSTDEMFLKPFVLAIIAAMLTICLVIFIRRARSLWSQHQNKNHRCSAATCQSEEIGMRSV